MRIEDVRALFPITATRAYLFSGGLAPAARPVKAALDEWSDHWAYDPGYHRARYFEEWDLVRERLARLIGAHADEIAITDNTSRGSNLVVSMLAPSAGSNVVVDDTTYPSSLYPWLLSGREGGVEVRRVSGPDGRVSVDDFRRVVDGRTVAVSVSHVSAMTGFRHDLELLAELAHQHGAYLIVDGAQSAGAIRLDVSAMGVDFLTGTAMKWLLGPPGIGFLYVSRQHLERLVPPQVGYVGAEQDTEGGGLRYKPGGRRLEIGLASLPGLPAFREGLDILLDVGIRPIEQRVLALGARVIEGLRQRDLRTITPADSRERGGVLAVPISRAEELAAFLRQRAVDIWGYPWQQIRVDPHVFNNEEDVDRFLTGIDEFVRSEGRSAVQ